MKKTFNFRVLSDTRGDTLVLSMYAAKSVYRRPGGERYLNLVSRERQRAMTIMEVVIALIVVAILAAVALPMYNDYIERTKIVQAKGDITDMDVLIAQFQSDNKGQYPNTLGDIGKAGLLDPWGNPYRYLNLSTMSGNGQVRKDKNLVPINSDYDLYSRGKDGATQGPLTAPVSRDDVIRASNGRFVGLASDY